MKKQYYFESEGSEYCYTKESFYEQMKRDGLKEMKVLKAVPDKDPGVFWCKEIGECCFDSSESCGAQNCESYTPRNGKSGCCVYYTNRIHTHGESVILKLPYTEQLKQIRPDLIEEYSKLSKEELLEQICAEVLDSLAMEDRVQLFMSECTINMSKTTYTLESLRSLIADKQEHDINEFCYGECEDAESNDEIAESIRERAKQYE